MEKTILVTGGAGFIGSHVIRLLLDKYPNYHIVNFDALTYASTLDNLKDIEKKENYTFINGNINQIDSIEDLFNEFKFDGIINLAAETHVDRSINNPNLFVQTNVFGTVNLLNAVKNSWKDTMHEKVFYQISTDEVYGALGELGSFTETSPYNPKSPYAASKAAADHFVRAYGNTYGIPFLISHCVNNYGPNQFPDKLIPLVINNIKENKSVPIYGDGKHTRSWLYVLDNARAVDVILHKGRIGESYNIGASAEYKNIDLIMLICKMMDEKLNRREGCSSELIAYVKDRPGHDRRYALDATKLDNELGWLPSVKFEDGLNETIDWYLNNQSWIDGIKLRLNQ